MTEDPAGGQPAPGRLAGYTMRLPTKPGFFQAMLTRYGPGCTGEPEDMQVSDTPADQVP